MLKVRKGPRTDGPFFGALMAKRRDEGGVSMRGIVALLLLLLALLPGCAVPGEEASSPAVHQAEAPRAENMRASMVENAPLPLLDAEVMTAYERALWVYGWFDLAPLPSGEETVMVGRTAYRRVNMEKIQDMEDLRACLRSVFTQELTDRLLDGKTARIQYREIDGALYVSGERRDQNAGKGAASVEVEQAGDGVCYVNVLVDLLDEDGETVVGEESWSFPYAFVEDRWVFTDFRLVY